MVGNNRGVLFSAFQTPPARRFHDVGCRSGAAPPGSPGRELVGGCASPRGPRPGHPLAWASPAPSGGCFGTGRRACVGRSTPAGSPLRVPGRSPSRSGARRGLLCTPEVSLIARNARCSRVTFAGTAASRSIGLAGYLVLLGLALAALQATVPVQHRLVDITGGQHRSARLQRLRSPG